MRLQHLLPTLALACLPLAAIASAQTITRAQAQETALARVPHGVVRSAELETEHGQRVWSFDIATPASKDIHEIQVDAKTGKVVRTEIETPEAQTREREADKHEAKAKKQ
ncbi:PepSY domain-containing protein [Lysobacter sp. KIS68-7]|uniref:PepSY domain-containing protein n=1 Tax=Lysobacter sp. KIS68-7 TaxID=2904252 RepID=UPI001E615045|nr:PepSY domain-containing protein [Lysobacter sp. KIS68-7]UHQ20203.1 PepSY domain-containing protein [Lysobacter sp. KIS68-7]